MAWACAGVVSRRASRWGLGLQRPELVSWTLILHLEPAVDVGDQRSYRWSICLHIIGKTPGKSSRPEQHLATISTGSLGLMEEDRVRRPLGRTGRGCHIGMMGGVQLEKEADMACGHPEGNRFPARVSAERLCPGDTDMPAQSLTSC